MMRFVVLVVLFYSHVCHSFGVVPTARNMRSCGTRSHTNVSPPTRFESMNSRHGLPLLQSCRHGSSDRNHAPMEPPNNRRQRGWWRNLWKRLDTIELAGYKGDTVLVSGLFGKVKQLHNPITYFVLGILAGFRWDWCFKSPLYWFAIGFTIKWYRARYVFKIPVWDRQPNWNNIITSKEQEKDLKAFTCKNCGSTIFIAKTREFFFEGSTGIGGLGCFSCGAKGAENFVMDRDRILEDVADVDDYFEYERPLDFVSRAERRKLLKEAEGDEDRANLILLERTTGISSTPAPAAAAPIDITSSDTDSVVAEDSPSTETDEPISRPETPQAQPTVVVTDHAGPNGSSEQTIDLVEKVVVVPSLSEPVPSTPKKVSPAPVPPKPKSSPTDKQSVDLEGLDELDMDAW